MSFIAEYFRTYSRKLFSDLQPSERLSFRLAGEDSLFLRWNQGRIRQSTQVQQFEVQWIYQNQGRQIEILEQLTLDTETDLRRGQARLERLRLEIPFLTETKELAPFPLAQERVSIEPGLNLSQADIADQIYKSGEGLDLVGIWASGPIVRAVAHSEGLFLFSSKDSAYFDYSIFRTNWLENGQREDKAVKGFIPGPASSDPRDLAAWRTDWAKSFAKSKEDLERLALPSRSVPAGKYRVYLSPRAFSDLIGFVHLGMSSYKRGQSPMKDLIEGKLNLSPQFSLSENFNLGFAPPFNRFGEYAPNEIPLITEGRFKNGFVSGRTAYEYGLESNAAEDDGWNSESGRSLEVQAGDLVESDVLDALDRGIYINDVHYVNLSDLKSARLTGMTRYACFWVENGQIVSPIQDLRFDVSLYQLLGPQLLHLTQERQNLLSTQSYFLRTWSGVRVPGVLADNFEFTL